MNIISDYLIPLIWAIGIFVAIMSLVTPRVRIAEEQGLVPIFEEFSSGAIHTFWFNGPLVRHSIYKDFVVLKCLGTCVVIPRNTLTVEATDSMLGEGLRYKSAKYAFYNLQLRTPTRDNILEVLGKNA
ncbi:hypothetical protein [Paraglaciecola sp. 25GB23A]|uniref:hypothetical protein n=1 Tax=Paraglaciecola sp. 25GB23A TaxID=3156068 RepID=UPI0032AFDA38